MKILIVLILTSTCVNLFAQTDTITDNRDGEKYETIIIGNKIWFKENLRHQTTLSYFPKFNKKTENLKKGNFYSNFELDSICPESYHVATIDDWENYFEIVLLKRNIPIKSIKIDTLPPPNNSIFITHNKHIKITTT